MNTVIGYNHLMEPGTYPSEAIEQVVLGDGTTVTIRPIRAEDAPRLQEGFRRLSSDSIYMRFLKTGLELPDDEAAYLANVDYQQRMALVGAIQEDGEERLVVVARYAMLERDEPGLAEAAVVVRDDYQQRGLGKQAMICLVNYARKHGVRAFIATVLVSNARILHFIQSSGLPYERKIIEPGVWEVRIDLP